MSKIDLEPRPNSIKYVIATSVGDGPEVISSELKDSRHLVNDLGLPKSCSWVTISVLFGSPDSNCSSQKDW